MPWSRRSNSIPPQKCGQPKTGAELASHVLIAGCETQGAVLSAAIAFLQQGKQVSVVAEACGAESQAAHKRGLDLAEQAGAKGLSDG